MWRNRVGRGDAIGYDSLRPVSAGFGAENSRPVWDGGGGALGGGRALGGGSCASGGGGGGGGGWFFGGAY